jgi:hypothetical protein
MKLLEALTYRLVCDLFKRRPLLNYPAAFLERREGDKR